MVLVGSVRPIGRTVPPTSPDKDWANQISEWSLPGRFAFFVFKIGLDGPSEEWFPGLQIQLADFGYYVGGTLDQWDSACYALLCTESPHDCCDIYRQIYNKLSSFGYTIRGEKTTQANRFYLK